MSNIGSYTSRSFSESQKFLVLDPSTGTTSLVLGSDLVSYITPRLNSVIAETTRVAAENTDYDIGEVIQTTGATSPGDDFAAVYLVVKGGTGDFPMINGNDLLVIRGDEFLREQLIDNTAGVGSDLVAHTGTPDTVTEALNKRTIYVDSVAEIEALSLPAGTNVYLTEDGRAGEGVVKSGTHPVDSQKGIFIDLSNGNYWERTEKRPFLASWFGIIADGTDENAKAQAALDLASAVGESDVYYPAGTLGLTGLLQPEGVNIRMPGKHLCTIERFSGTAALIIARSNCEISGFTADGLAVSAGNGDAISIDGKTNIKLFDLRLVNNANDGILCRNSSFIYCEDIETEGNFRNGGSFTDNNTDLTFGEWRSKGDAVAGLDLEPNTTTNSRIRAKSIHMDNAQFGFQGNSASIYNEDIQIDFISAKNGGVIQFTKALECNVDQVEIDETSSMNIDQKVTGGFGQSTGIFSNIRWRNKPTSGENLIRNGAFRDYSLGWQIVEIGSGTASVVDDPRASFYGKMLRCETFGSGDSASFVQEFSASEGDLITFAFDLISEAERPHGTIRFRDSGSSTINEVRMADLPTADSVNRRHYYMGVAPASTATVQILLGGAFSNGGAFIGYFDAASLRINCTQFDYGENQPPIKFIYTDGLPSQGEFKVGDFAFNTRATIDGNNMQIIGYRRLTDGSGHVINTDWEPNYVSTVSPAT